MKQTNICRLSGDIKNDDVTIMMSSGHVMASVLCTINSRLLAMAGSYWLYIETIPLSGIVSEIFSAKVATMIIRDDVISDVIKDPYRLSVRTI